VAITGEPGGGKTTLALLLIMQLALRGVRGTPRTGAKRTVMYYIKQLPAYLRLLGGLTTEEIARAFLAPEPTIAKVASS